MAHAPIQAETDAVDIETLGRSLVQASVPIATTVRLAGEQLTKIRVLWDAGVTIAFGTDSFVPDPTDDIRQETEALARVLSPGELLTALTRNAAAYLGLNSEIGTLEVGKRADVVIIDGDPLARVDDLRNVAVVIQAGNVVVDNR